MDPCAVLGTAGLRVQVTAQLFKSMLLREEHDPDRPQTDAVFRTMGEHGHSPGDPVSRRTWANWAKGDQAAKDGKAAELDAIAQRAIRLHGARQGPGHRLPDGFFHALARGGLLRAMFSGRSKVMDVFEAQRRAATYRPLSAWHLQLDALEVAALDFGYRQCSWSTMKAVAAARVLECLDVLWGPRQGRIYPLLSWRVGGLRGAPVDWTKANVGVDAVPIYVGRNMLALLADEGFLRRDRLVAWSWDLSTAALATGALLWCDRYTHYTRAVSDTLVIALALDCLCFARDREEADVLTLEAAVELANVAWSLRVRRILAGSAAAMRAERHRVGMSEEALLALKEKCVLSRPLRFVG